MPPFSLQFLFQKNLFVLKKKYYLCQHAIDRLLLFLHELIHRFPFNFSILILTTVSYQQTQCTQKTKALWESSVRFKNVKRPCVSLPQGFHNGLPPTWRLKTTEVYSLTVLEARSPKSVSLGPNRGVSRALLLAKALVENPAMVVPAVPWLVATSLPAPPPSLQGLLFSLSNLPRPFSYKNNCHWIQGRPG